MSTLDDSYFRFEGRCLPPGKKISLRNLHHNDFTDDQMKRLNLVGLPLWWNHQFQIGKVEKSWLGDDGSLYIQGMINTDNEPGKFAMEEITSKKRSGLSLTHIYKFGERPSKDPGYIEFKNIKELSIVREQDTERPNCLIMTDDLTKAKQRIEELTKQNTQIVSELEKFTENARLKDQEMEKIHNELQKKTSHSEQLQGQLNNFYARQKEALDIAKKEMIGYFPESPEFNKALDTIQGCADKDHSLLEGAKTLFEVVCENMRDPSRKLYEEAIQDKKADLLIRENRARFTKRHRSFNEDDYEHHTPMISSTSPSSSASAPSSSSYGRNKIDDRDIALLQRFKETQNEIKSQEDK